MPGRRMHADEVHTGVPLVRRLLAAQFPQWASLPVELVPSSGTDNALYRLGADMVVRLPRIEWAAELVDKEYEWLPRLASSLPVAVPVPLAKGVPGEGYPWPWSVCPWLEGENPTVDRIPDAASLAIELARFIVGLHAVDPAGGPAAGSGNFFRGAPLAVRDEPTSAAIDALRGVVDTDAVTAAWEATLGVPAWPGPPVWVHGDLSPGNLLCVHGRLSAVIDFGCLGVGDPAADVIPAWNLLPAEARDDYRSALQVDDETWARGRGWALSIALIQLPYYKDTNPVLAANSRKVIDEVLADHRTSGR
jgi:aminoglycoside phosphotransferase (APT) family kinase protein